MRLSNAIGKSRVVDSFRHAASYKASQPVDGYPPIERQNLYSPFL